MNDEERARKLEEGKKKLQKFRAKSKQFKSVDKTSVPLETRNNASSEVDVSVGDGRPVNESNGHDNHPSERKAQTSASAGSSQAVEDDISLAGSSKPGTVLHWLAERNKRMKVVAAATAELEQAVIGLTCDPRLSASQTSSVKRVNMNSLMRTAHDLVLRVQCCNVSPATTVKEEDEFPFVADVLADLRKLNSSLSKMSREIEPVPKGVNGSDDQVDSLTNGENPPHSGPEGPSPNQSTKFENSLADFLNSSRETEVPSDLPKKSTEFPPIFLDNLRDIGGFSESKASDQLSASEIRLLTQQRKEEPLNDTISTSNSHPKSNSGSGFQKSYKDYDTVNQLTWENTSLQRRVEVQASALIELSVEKEKWMGEKYKLIDEQEKARKRIKLLLEEKEELKLSLQRVIEGLVTENQFLSQVASVRHDPNLQDTTTRKAEEHTMLETQSTSSTHLLGSQSVPNRPLENHSAEETPHVSDHTEVNSSDSRAYPPDPSVGLPHSLQSEGNDASYQSLDVTALHYEVTSPALESKDSIAEEKAEDAQRQIEHDSHPQESQGSQGGEGGRIGNLNASESVTEYNRPTRHAPDATAVDHSLTSPEPDNRDQPAHPAEQNQHIHPQAADHEDWSDAVFTKDKSSVRKAPPPRPFPPELLAHPGDKDIQIGLKHLFNPPKAAPPPAIYYVFDALWSVVSLRPVRTALFHSHKAEIDDDEW